MSVTEIVLIAAGAAVMLLGYFLPAKKEEKKDAAPQIDEEQIKKIVQEEVDHAGVQIKDIVDETVTYSMEKTERAMERLTNEKIMAVNEYSDTVLETINKNHKEAVFLYDMLSEKHEALVETVGRASQTAGEIHRMTEKEPPAAKKKKEETPGRTKKAAAAESTESADPKPEETATGPKAGEAQQKDLQEEADFAPISPPRVMINGERNSGSAAHWQDTEMASAVPGVEINFAGREENNNKQILRLHRLGKSRTAIARELGLGTGEVKLVIDLFESM